MTAILADVVNEPPSAADLAWEADRLSLDALEPQHREWFEQLAKIVYEAWPDDVDVEALLTDLGHENGQCMPSDVWDDLLVLLAAEGCEFDAETDDEEREYVPAENVAAAVKTLLEKRAGEARNEGVKDATIPSRANAAQRKAMRLLVDGRVNLKRREVAGPLEGLIVAEVRGDTGQLYACGYDPRHGRWRCTCPELRGDCSHLAAVKMVAA